MPLVEADPAPLTFDPARAALVVIDMQRDFLEPGGFGETLGNDVSLLAAAVGPCGRALEAARASGLLVIHTLEWATGRILRLRRPKLARRALEAGVGRPGPCGRIGAAAEPATNVDGACRAARARRATSPHRAAVFFAHVTGTGQQCAGRTPLAVLGHRVRLRRGTTEGCASIPAARRANTAAYRCGAFAELRELFPGISRGGRE